MNLTADMPYIEETATARLANNVSEWHIADLGDMVEIRGAAGELAARRLLGLDENLHSGFDGGTDLLWRGWTIDVKTIQLCDFMYKYYLQQPVQKLISADIFLVMAFDLENEECVPVGWCTNEELAHAKINRNRKIACREIRVQDLHSVWSLYTLKEKHALGQVLSPGEYLTLTLLRESA